MSERRFPWRTLLFLSVAANLLVIGAVAGGLAAGVRLERQAPGAVVDRMPGPRAFVAALPEDARAKVRAELAESWDDSRAARRAAMQARRDAFAAAAEEPYDVERVRAAFARLRAADQQAVGVFHDNMARAFGELSPEQRRHALAALRRAPAASRRSLAPAEDGARPADAPAVDRETIRERREERRERWRERREQRRQERQTP
ncbi:MAG TPA: periplasmic heavy metal sensor [Vitreimonas sp.]|uniref:periplasmic heavy metal sensor n=1 Tax=Vitreimonas sp. TaxID=3069702 RepID=UPI002D69C69B|nr:periplasmic heavy metal sensor [Vitreimonas sp.]HYD89204.1 periplasmic heavy metal sensor [Vitreimonas sp.]